MVNWLIHIRKTLENRRSDAVSICVGNSSVPGIFQFFQFVIVQFSNAGLQALQFLLMIPVHLKMSPQQSFQSVARRSVSGEFLESYTSLLRQQRLAVLTVVAFLITAGIELSVLGFGVYEVVKPKATFAYTTSIDLSPTWDITSVKETWYNDDFAGGCVELTNYSCQEVQSQILDYGRSTSPPTDCQGVVDWLVTWRRSVMKFSTASIPNNAAVTKVELIVTVSGTGNANIIDPSSDLPDTLSCDNSQLNDSISGAGYATGVWGTTGQKTVDLGANAVTDVQNRITGTDIIAFGLKTSEFSNYVGGIWSQNAGTPSNRPILRVTYTLPPQAPTGTSHSSNATDSVTWTWSDNATADTRYDVHDAAHANVTGCTALAANSQSCTETGLSVNTQYTRHPNVTDPQGNTDGPSASAYTTIETPTGLSFGSITTTGITVAATGSLSNLTSGTSGLYFQESVTSTNSGWTQTNSWAKSGLSANTQYSFQAKARNGDADETGLTTAATKYTLSTVPDVTSTRSASTWYTANPFPFTNAAVWGAGGVQYYRYVWDQNATHAFNGSESTWSNVNANCPGGTCTDAGTTLNKTATADGNNWYLHVRSFSGDGTANGAGTDYGPYFFNGTSPTITDNQADDTTPRRDAGTTYDVNFAKAAAGPQLDYAQYAVYAGPNKTGTLLKDWTNIFTADTDSYGTDWSVDFTALQQGTNYVSVRVAALDALSSETDDAFTVLKDTVAPVISAMSASVTVNSAVLTWTTDEPATTQVEWGTTSGYGNTTTLDSTLSTSHSVTLSGLSANAGFHARALGTDEAGNSGASSDLAFSTLPTPMTIITNATVTVNGPTTVTVTWTTNEPATSKVRYGPTTDYGLETSDATLVTSHSIVLTGLTPGTQYHYEVISVGSTTDNDADATFTTSYEGVVTTLADVRVIAGETIATFTWTTNEPATSKVRYGPTTTYGFVKSASSKVTAHRLQVKGLEPGTTYYYRVESVGTTSAASKDLSFTTGTPETTANRAIGPTVLDATVRERPLLALDLSGVAKGSQTLRVYVDGKAVASVKTTGSARTTKAFDVSVPLKNLAAGSHTLHLQSTDAAGRTSRVLQKLTFVVNDGASSVAAVKVKGGKTTYVVKSGDSLWRIAQTFYGNGASYTKLIAENGKVFPGLGAYPHQVQPGWALVVP